MKRGERMARHFLGMSDDAGIRAKFSKVKGQWAIEVLNSRPWDDEKLDAITHLFLFAFAYPRNFGILVRPHDSREAEA